MYKNEEMVKHPRPVLPFQCWKGYARDDREAGLDERGAPSMVGYGF